MNSKLVNLTPHPISVFTEDDELMTIQPEGTPVRLNETRKFVGTINGVPFIEKKFNGGNLPQPQLDTFYVVSLPVAQAFPDREDLLVCDNFRKEKGRIVGCENLARMVVDNG